MKEFMHSFHFITYWQNVGNRVLKAILKRMNVWIAALVFLDPGGRKRGNFFVFFNLGSLIIYGN